MKVLFIYTINPGVAYYRMYMFAKMMSKLQLAETRFFPHWDQNRGLSPDWEGHLEQNWPVMREQIEDWADIVIVQYVSTEEGLSLVEAIKDLKPCLMEVDDYFAGVPGYSHAYNSNKPGDRQDYFATRQMIVSTGVVTSTEYLRNKFLEYNKNVKVIPNCVDFDTWDLYKKHSNGLIKIGWAGGASHEGDLKLIKDVIYEILEYKKNVQVEIVCPQDWDWKRKERLKFTQKVVTIENYPEYLKSDLSFDIGISPLRDNEFNRGKSNLRYLENSACYTPVVASNVEPFRKDFQGILANDDDEWFNALCTLIDDIDYRLKIGWNGYWDVKSKFNLELIAKRYGEYLEEMRGKWMDIS